MYMKILKLNKYMYFSEDVPNLCWEYLGHGTSFLLLTSDKKIHLNSMCSLSLSRETTVIVFGANTTGVAFWDSFSVKKKKSEKNRLYKNRLNNIKNGNYVLV